MTGEHGPTWRSSPAACNKNIVHPKKDENKFSADKL